MCWASGPSATWCVCDSSATPLYRGGVDVSVSLANMWPIRLSSVARAETTGGEGGDIVHALPRSARIRFQLPVSCAWVQNLWGVGRWLGGWGWWWVVVVEVDWDILCCRSITLMTVLSTPRHKQLCVSLSLCLRVPPPPRHFYHAEVFSLLALLVLCHAIHETRVLGHSVLLMHCESTAPPGWRGWSPAPL